MVVIEFTSLFEKRVRKIQPQDVKEHVKKQIQKVVESPETGKPMMHARKGTREAYIPPFRLSYAYVKEEDKIIKP